MSQNAHLLYYWRCKNCSCKRKNLLCVNCAPCQHGRCGNLNLPGEPMSASQPVPETNSILHSKNGNPFFVSGASNSDYSSFFPSSSCPPLSAASATSGKTENTVPGESPGEVSEDRPPADPSARAHADPITSTQPSSERDDEESNDEHCSPSNCLITEYS